MIELKGLVERIIFHNEETSYTVAKIKLCKKGTVVTVSGIFLSLNSGDELKLQGNWRSHPTYGKHFKVDSYEPLTR